MVEPRRVIFREIPAAADPYLDPAVVAAVVVPRGRPGETRRDSRRAQGVDQQHRKPRTGGHMLPHRLGRALVGLFAGGVVLHPDVGRDIPVHGVDRRADVAAKRHAPGEARVEIRPPAVAHLVHGGIGQYLVQEERNRAAHVSKGSPGGHGRHIPHSRAAGRGASCRGRPGACGRSGRPFLRAARAGFAAANSAGCRRAGSRPARHPAAVRIRRGHRSRNGRRHRDTPPAKGR